MKRLSSPPVTSRRFSVGMTLIELMIALVLGLLVLAAAIGIFVSNKQVFRSTESLGRLQESARVAYEMMAREIREAGGNPCSRNVPIVNVLKNPTSNWATNWGDGVRGYDNTQVFAGVAFGTTPGARVSGTDAIELRSGAPGEVTVTDHKPTSAQFKVNTNNHGLSDGDIVMVCDFVQASIFQITTAQNGINNTVVHNKGTGTPGNCSKGLGWANPPDCTSPNGTPYAYGPNSTIARLRATAWYIGNNDRGTRSLYKVTGLGAGLTNSAQEITEDVQDMQIEYLLQTPGTANYVAATAGTDWSKVSAVRIVLSMQGAERVGTDGNQLRRTVEHVVSLRNRNL